MHKILHIFLLLLAGGLATSSAEYLLKYNLVDLIKDKILGLFGKAKAEAAVLEVKVKTIEKKL